MKPDAGTKLVARAWTTADRRQVRWHDMDDSHLRNTFLMIRRWRADDSAPWWNPDYLAAAERAARREICRRPGLIVPGGVR